MIPQHMIDSVGAWDAEMQQEVLKFMQSLDGGRTEWIKVAKDNLESMAKCREFIAMRDAKIKYLETVILHSKGD